MDQNIISKEFLIDGMDCIGCERKIENKLKLTAGIIKVKVNYNSGKGIVTFDQNKIKTSQIIQIIGGLDYKVLQIGKDSTKHKDTEKVNISQLAYIVLIIFGFSMIINHFGGFDIFNSFPEAKEGMGYATLFIIGLLTSVHCIAMCGGINLSQCVPQVAKIGGSKFGGLRPSILYNLGRVISYTVIGGIVGGLGSVISFSGVGKGIVAIFAGLFMIIMGLNLLNIFPWLRKFNLRLPKYFTRNINKQKRSNSPIYVGLLNGLMPCGPLQAMQLYALSTGDPVKGAISMFVFSLGTVPLMFGFGAISTLLSKRFTKKMMSVSAVLVIILGVMMFNNGMSLSGFSLGTSSGATTQNSESIKIEEGVQTVVIDISTRSYAPITVKKGIPVRWVVRAEAKNINGCNNRIVVPSYNISKKLVPGENIIEFTPSETGVIPYSCWMGMIRSKITVVN